MIATCSVQWRLQFCSVAWNSCHAPLVPVSSQVYNIVSSIHWVLKVSSIWENIQEQLHNSRQVEADEESICPWESCLCKRDVSRPTWERDERHCHLFCKSPGVMWMILLHLTVSAEMPHRNCVTYGVIHCRWDLRAIKRSSIASCKTMVIGKSAVCCCSTEAPTHAQLPADCSRGYELRINSHSICR